MDDRRKQQRRKFIPIESGGKSLATLILIVLFVVLTVAYNKAHALIADGTPLFTWTDPQTLTPTSFKLSCDGSTLATIGGTLRTYQTAMLVLASGVPHTCYLIAANSATPVLTENSGNTVTFTIPKPKMLLIVQ